MATPNYGYEKRQKELAKKRKNEDKLKAKADRKAGVLPPSSGDADSRDAENGVTDPGAPGSGQTPSSGN